MDTLREEEEEEEEAAGGLRGDRSAGSCAPAARRGPLGFALVRAVAAAKPGAAALLPGSLLGRSSRAAVMGSGPRGKSPSLPPAAGRWSRGRWEVGAPAGLRARCRRQTGCAAAAVFPAVNKKPCLRIASPRSQTEVGFST